MDTPQTITHVSLCAGYGGIDIGLKRAIPNLRTIAFSEIEAFACANLVSKMEAGLLDPAPIWTNLKTFPWEEFFDRVDILSGGYPCQPFSAAGKRQGADDPRHLWPHISAGIAAMRPAVCFFENVEGHISLGLPDVIEDLARMGYRTTWGIFSASEVGATHQRKRVFILAYNSSTGLQGREWFWQTRAQGESDRYAFECGRKVWPSRPGEQQFAWEPPRVVGNSILHGHAAGEITGGTGAGETEGRLQEFEGGSASMGNASQRQNHGREPGDLGQATGEGRCGNDAADGASEVLGNPNSPRPQERQGQRGAGIQGTNADGREGADRQAQPALGRDAHGTSDRLDDAELQEPDHADCGADAECGGELAHTYSERGRQSGGQRKPREVEENASDIQGQGNQQAVVPDHESHDGGGSKSDLYTSCDNRTDELRLLGNGVVPATAERAFRILSEELF